MTEFPCFYLDEPDLIFGFQGEDKDPKLGLKRFGPYFSKSEQRPSPSEVRVGIIGSGETITLTKLIIDLIRTEIRSNENNRWLYPDFPGFSRNAKINSDIINSERWNAAITQFDIDNILKIVDVNERIAAASTLFVTKLESIALEEDFPQVVICALPKIIEEYCGISKKTRGAKRPRFTPLEKEIAKLKARNQSFLTDWGINFVEYKESEPQRDYDLHNSIKGKSMKIGIPTQVLRESTSRAIIEYPNSEFPIRQNPATFAWNFSMGLYYKASGRPWRLAKLIPGTCYVGISFYRNLRNPDLNMETSMAQIFTHSGEGFVLRGSDVVVDERTREPHMSAEQSEDLIKDVILKFTTKTNTGPGRVVIHKTSGFTDEEKNGFRKGIGNVPTDLLLIRKYTPIRFLRFGEYPVLRGTVIMLSPREYLLFTGGYIPRLRTYPGQRVPEPLHILHEGDSDTHQVCKEILGLTKLNWNTTAFSDYDPITLEFSSRVGKILSELPDDYPIQDHYRFYM